MPRVPWSSSYVLLYQKFKIHTQSLIVEDLLGSGSLAFFVVVEICQIVETTSSKSVPKDSQPPKLVASVSKSFDNSSAILGGISVKCTSKIDLGVGSEMLKWILKNCAAFHLGRLLLRPYLLLPNLFQHCLSLSLKVVILNDDLIQKQI